MRKGRQSVYSVIACDKRKAFAQGRPSVFIVMSEIREVRVDLSLSRRGSGNATEALIHAPSILSQEDCPSQNTRPGARATCDAVARAACVHLISTSPREWAPRTRLRGRRKNAMPHDRYLRYEPSVEQPRPDEAQTIEAIVASIQRTNKSSFDRHHHGIRQQHAKGQGYLRGELKIYDNLPAHLRQGIFASPGTYPIIVRLSTAFGDIRSDRIRVPRGMAIKVLGVSGRKALPGDTSTNQDFLLVNHKSYFADAAAYLSAQRSFEVGAADAGFRTQIWASARGSVNFSSRTGSRIPMVLNALGEAGNNILGETFLFRRRDTLWRLRCETLYGPHL